MIKALKWFFGFILVILLGGLDSPNNMARVVSQDNPVIWSLNGQFGANGLAQGPEALERSLLHLYEYAPNKLIAPSLAFDRRIFIQWFGVYAVDAKGQVEYLPSSLVFFDFRKPSTELNDPIVGIQTNGRIVYLAENNQLKALTRDLTPDLTFGSVATTSLPSFVFLNTATVMSDDSIILLDYTGSFYQLDTNASIITKTGQVPALNAGTWSLFNKYSGTISLSKAIFDNNTLLYYQVDVYDIYGKIVESRKIAPDTNRAQSCGKIFLHFDGGFIILCDAYREYMFPVYANEQKYHTIRRTTSDLEENNKIKSCTPETCPCISNFTLFALQTDGKYVFADFTDYGLPSAKLKITRCLPDASYDPTFGQNGVLTLPFPKQTFQLKDLLVQQDGQIVLAFAQDSNIDINLVDKDLRGFFLIKIGPINIRNQQFLPMLAK